MKDELNFKVGREEGEKLWKNFENYAKYDDLRDLY